MDEKIPTDPRELACYLNAQHNLRIVQGIGKESRECGVYDPQYDTEILAKAIEEIKKEAFEHGRQYGLIESKFKA